MNFSSVIFDADGVLIDSRAQSWEAGRRIASLFDLSVQIDNQESYRRNFSHIAQTVAIEDRHIETLRALHRLLMRHNAPGIELFDNVVRLAAMIVVPRFVVTAALAAGTRVTLNKHAELFGAIIGNEAGQQERNTTWAATQFSPGLYHRQYSRCANLPIIGNACDCDGLGL